MKTLSIYTAENAPEKSRSLLAGAKSKFGFIPNLLGVLAEAPTSLEGYLALADLLAKSSLRAKEREVVLIAGSVANGCRYCVAAHSTMAKMQKVPEEVVDALREGRPLPDPRLEALRRFTETLIEKRGMASEQDVQSFFDAGFSRQQMLEVILGLALKTLSNFTNNLADTTLDEAFAAEAEGFRKAG